MSRRPHTAGRSAWQWPRLRALARVGSLLLAFLLISLVFAGYTLHARASELMADAGAQMLAYAGARQLDGAHGLLLNGLRLHMQVGSTADPVPRVLASLGTRCRAHSGQLPLQLQERARGQLLVAITAKLLDPVLERGDERAGFVGCLDLGAQRVSPEQLLIRLRRFVPDADVAEIGGLRFAWALREGELTRYIAVWSDQRLPLRRAFPASGDAPGSDAPGVPRPASARRVLSAWQDGSAPLLVAYQSAHALPAAADAYVQQLQAQGFRVRRAPARPDGSCGLAASRANASVAVMLTPHAGGALLSLAPLR